MKKTVLLLIFLTSLQAIIAQSPTQQWLSKYNGKGDNSDKFNAIKVDASGNIYLAGYSVSTGNKKDFLTVKMNSSGDTLWTRKMDGSGNSDDEALELVIDASGNTYVTGVSKGATSEDDYLTIMYSATGVLQWSATYNYIYNQDEMPTAIGVDGTGNVYVTGFSDNDVDAAVINDDYATVKYSSTGLQLWANRYNGAGNATDRATGMAVTSAGVVYISGRSDNGTDDDFVTIKYTTGGVQTWLTAFDSGDKDKAEVLTIDASENVYVSGRSNNGTDDDYLTIKYSTNGLDLWGGGTVYDSGTGDEKPTAIAVDGSGNVYVTGRSDSDISALTNYNFATIKYNLSGSQQWAATYNGTGNGSDTPSGIEVDGTGKVIVCGQYDADASLTVTNNNCLVISYTSTGVQSWLILYNGTSNLSDGANALAIDGSGTIYIAGGSDNLITQKDALVAKYTTTGTLAWAKNYNGKGDNSDNVNKIVVDASGNSYLAGYTYNAGSEKDLLVVKLSPIGDTLWTKKYNGTSNNSDEAMDIAVDAAGNVYITGYAKESITGYNFITSKYTSTGILSWSTQYNNAVINGSDKASNLLVDATGNVFVIGSSYSSPVGNEDYLIVKYNSTGVQQWINRYNGSSNASDIPIGIKQNGTDTYVTGKSFNGTYDVIATVKYNSTGVQLWEALYSSTNGTARPAGLEIDATGNVFIIGRTNNGMDDDFVTIKYNTSGVQQWATLYNSTTGDDRGTAIAIDAFGNSYVTGQSSNGLTDNFTTVKYNSTGVQQWLVSFDGVAMGNDVPTSIKIDNLGDIVVAGESNNGTSLVSNTDFTFIKYHSNGLKVWEKSYDGNDHLTDGINAFAIDNSNNIYLTGNSSLLTEQKNILTIKYDSPVGLNELNMIENNTHVFPNPFTVSTTISISSEITVNENTTFELYDILGNKVKSMDKIQENIFKIERGTLSNGMYIYKLNQAGKNISTGKITVQ